MLVAGKRAYPVISIPKICWEGKTQLWMSLFLLALGVVAVAHQGELRPFASGPAVSCFEDTGGGIGSSRPTWASWWADLWAKGSFWACRKTSMSRAVTGHLLVLFKQTQQTLEESGQFWGGGTIVILFHWHFLFPFPAHHPFLIVCFPGLSCIRVPLCNWGHIELWLKPSFLKCEELITGISLYRTTCSPQLETKSLFCWELNKWKCAHFSCIFSLKWLCLFLSGVVIFAGTCQG